MNLNKNIFLITGGNGMLGNALKSKLNADNKEYLAPNSQQLNLLLQHKVDQYLILNQNISCVFHLAAKVGGVKANNDSL